VIRPQIERSLLKAHDLLPKLKLLYKLGMVAFMHHLDQGQFKSRAVIAKTVTGKHGAEQEPMQFPTSLPSWNYIAEIEDANADVERVNLGGIKDISSTNLAR